MDGPQESSINEKVDSDSGDNSQKSHVQKLNTIEQSIIQSFLKEKSPGCDDSTHKEIVQRPKINRSILDSSDESGADDDIGLPNIEINKMPLNKNPDFVDNDLLEDSPVKSYVKKNHSGSKIKRTILDSSDESDVDDNINEKNAISKDSEVDSDEDSIKIKSRPDLSADTSKKSSKNKYNTLLESSDESDTDSKKSKSSRNSSPERNDLENDGKLRAKIWADKFEKSSKNKSNAILDSSDESDTGSKKSYSVKNNKSSRNTSPERNDSENDGISRPDLWADSPEKPHLKENCSGKKSKNRSKTDPGGENALDGIRSETQRLVRESRVSLPYHKPKQRTLADFLNRRNSTPGISLHTSFDKMTKVWKQIEDREKEAECFYKSESEDECSSTTNIDKPELSIDECLKNTDCVTTQENTENTKEPNVDYVSSGYTQNLSELELRLNDTEMTPEIENIIDIEKLCLPQNQNSEIKFSDMTINTIPKLSGAPDELVDLDVITPKCGVTGLLKRFIKHAGFIKKPIATEDTMLEIVSSEINDKQEVVNVTREKIQVKCSENPKPGESLVKLKATLQQKMANLREETLAKKQEEMKLYESEFYEGEKEVCDGEKEDEFDEESEESGTSDEETEDEKLNGDDDADDEKEKDMLFADTAQESDCSEDTQDSDKSLDSDEPSQKSIKLKNEFSDETNVKNYGSDKDIFSLSSGNLLNQPTNIDSNLARSNSDSIQELVKKSIESDKDIFGLANSIDDSPENLLSFCSGKFPSQSINLVDLEKPQLNDELISDDHVTSSNIGFENDDSDDDDFGLPKIKKKCQKLTFSDDEDDDDNDTKDEEKSEDDEVENEEVEEEEEIIEEDDEETLLAKKLSKGFLDGEAELSGSEWDSADEDERDLDKFEEEEGDADHISNRKLQKELGKIHMKELMADDKREIRVLKELLLEDGDLHSDGPKRQRLFRWANQDDVNFDQTLCQADDDQMDENEIEDEETWRKQRIERENFLKQKKIDNLSVEFDENELSFNINRPCIKKPLAPNIVPISPDPKAKFKLMTSRSSFLTRGEKILSKIANITSNKADNNLNNNLRGRNMIFTAVSPSKNENKNNDREKRKAECSSQIPTQKKIKLTPSTTKASIFDKLKMSD